MQELRLIRKVAKDFSTEKALKEYLREHPNADKSKHHVVEHDAEPKQSLSERIKGLSSKAQDALAKAPGAVKSFVTDKKVRDEKIAGAKEAIKSLPEKAARKFIDTAKEEVHEFKEAGAGVKAVLKGGKMNQEQKHAFKAVGLHLGLAIASAALASVGLAAGTAVVGKSIAKHVAIKAVSRAMANLHVLEEMGHVGHGIVEVMTKLSAEKDSDKVMLDFMKANVMKELDNLKDEGVLEALEDLD